MDYLNKLPAELWREIISQTVVPFNYISLPDSVSLHPAESIGWSNVQRNQNTLCRLLPTSKAFHALIEPSLYREIYIETEAAYRQFLGSAKAPPRSPSGHRRGKWTKEIFIFDKNREASDTMVYVDELLCTCPNVIHLSVLVTSNIREISWKTDDAWSSSIRSISLGIPSIGPEHLLYIANHCPGLTTLKLTYATNNRNWTTACGMKFPSLVYLSLSHHFTDDDILDALECPQLQTLHIEDAGRGCMEWFLERHAETLTRLKIYPSALLWDEILFFPRNMFRACEGLTWLSFAPDYMEPLSIETPYEQLVHLDLVWEPSVNPSNWKQHAEVFLSPMFPNLSLVTLLVPAHTPASAQEALLRNLKPLFLGAKVEVNVDIPR